MTDRIKYYYVANIVPQYKGYMRGISDLQLAMWQAEHTQLFNELSKERLTLGEVTYREDQNRFRARRSTSMVIAGKPDLIAIDALHPIIVPLSKLVP